MKEERRKELLKIHKELLNLQNKIEAITKEHQEEFDNKDISFQERTCGAIMERELGNLREACYHLGVSTSYLFDSTYYTI